MNTFLAPEKLLEEAAEQHSNESPFLALNGFHFNMLHLSFSASRMVALLLTLYLPYESRF